MREFYNLYHINNNIINMRRFYNLYYFNYNIMADYRAPLIKAKNLKYLYKSNYINIKSFILCGLYNINEYGIINY